MVCPAEEQTLTIKINRKLKIQWCDPRTLTPNPRNFRRHPETQRKVLRAALEEEGWIDPVLVNKRTGHIIDGHARIDEAFWDSVPLIPVLMLDLDEATEKKVMARHDRIGALAEINEE